MGQVFHIYLDNLTNIKYISINNYTHGSEMTISIAKEHKYFFIYKSALHFRKYTRISMSARERHSKNREKTLILELCLARPSKFK
jgi:hypothetical protein